VRHIGKIEVRVPQDPAGGSTRKVKAVTGELCDYAFSSASVSRMVTALDDELERSQAITRIWRSMLVMTRRARMGQFGAK
jgi:hypothetical protein